MTQPINILALGDSLTEGFGLSPADAFPAVLEQLLRERGHLASVLNLGLSGDTTLGGLQRLQRFFNLQRSAQTYPHAAIVELGANDGLNGIMPEEVEANLNAILSLLGKRKIPVLFTGMRALFCENNFFADERYCNEFAELFPRLAKQHGSIFYPFFLEGIFGKPELNLEDQLHPNATGTRMIAEKICPLVEQLLKEQAYK